MRSTTVDYRRIIASGETRNWEITVNLTLSDGTSLSIDESDIMDNSFKVISASSGDSSFDIGAAIIGKCQFTLNNYDDRFTQYDFFNATAVVRIRLVGDIQSTRLGFFTVDEPTFAGSLVSLELLDNMWKFDRPLPTLNPPFTILSVVHTLCTHCGVTLSTTTFNGYNVIINSMPDNEMNCREMLQYLAMIGCNFCVIDSQGYLNIRWYNVESVSTGLDGGTFSTNTTPYSDGDDADGGNFTNYSSGDSYDGGTFYDGNVVYFSRLMTRNIGTDEIEITGVKFVIDETEYLIGQNGYVLTLDNPFVNANNVTSVLNRIWDRLEGFKFRIFDVTALPDITPEVGDAVGVSYKGTILYSYLTNFTFTPSLVTASLGAESVTRTLSVRYNKNIQVAVDQARKEAEKEISDYDLIVQQMNLLAVNALGAYQNYEDLSTGGRVYYLSNMPITKTNNVCSFETGSIVYKLTGSGFFVSRDGGQTWVNGYDPDTGQLVINVLYAIGIHADWVVTGLLKDAHNYNYWNLDTGEFRLAATTLIGTKTIDEHIGDEIDDTLTQEDVFNRLTNNGQTQGIVLSNGELYINATYINTGTMSADRVRTGYLYSDNYDFTTGNQFLNTGTSINMNNGDIFTYGASIFGSVDQDGNAAYFRRIRIKPNNSSDSEEHYVIVESTTLRQFSRLTAEHLLITSDNGRTLIEEENILLGFETVKHTKIDTDVVKVANDQSNYTYQNYYDLIKVVNNVAYGVTWNTSDRNVKEEIEPLDIQLSKELIDNTETKKFKYKGAEGKHYGMIAQDVRKLLDGLGEEDARLEHEMAQNQRTIDYQEYIPHLINYVQDLRAEINELKAEIQRLKEV